MNKIVLVGLFVVSSASAWAKVDEPVAPPACINLSGTYTHDDIYRPDLTEKTTFEQAGCEKLQVRFQVMSKATGTIVGTSSELDLADGIFRKGPSTGMSSFFLEPGRAVYQTIFMNPPNGAYGSGVTVFVKDEAGNLISTSVWYDQSGNERSDSRSVVIYQKVQD